MKKIIESVVAFVAIILIAFMFIYAALNAWDYTMSDEEVVHYYRMYPEDKKLNKIIQQRNINIDDFVEEE